jgi:ABC-2 type transport system permease protein
MPDPGVVAIARKEFSDHIRSHRFLILLGILVLVASMGVISGTADYHAKVKQYDSMQESVSSSPAKESSLPAYLEYMYVKPSVLLVFYKMSLLVIMIGGILGIAMGFDLVTREKESKSLKILLAHPIYRDEVINGKALGGLAAIAIALFIVLALSFGILLVAGIVPEGSEFFFISLFALTTFLYISTCFAISLLMSTICDESGKALIYSLVVFIVLTSLVPTVLGTPLVMKTFIGPQPEMPQVLAEQLLASLQDNGGDASGSAAPADTPAEDPNKKLWDQYNEQTREYGDRQMRLRDTQYLFSPAKNYEKIATCLTSPEMIRFMLYFTTIESPLQKTNDQGQVLSATTGYMPDLNFDESGILSMIAGNLVALFVLPSVFFGLAYIGFMRMDIR